MIKADVSSPEKAPVVAPEKSITTVCNLFLQKKEIIQKNLHLDYEQLPRLEGPSPFSRV
jgi:hypothetical protein